jgi:predicted 2-oxoglutarate/Fe(II)-dependent dioxygenase YbiX
MKKITHVIFGYHVCEYSPCNIYVIHKIINKNECIDLMNFIDNLTEFQVREEIRPGNNVECLNIHMEEVKKRKTGDEEILKYDKNIFDIIHIALTLIKVINPKINMNIDSGYQLRKIFGKTEPHVDAISSSTSGYSNFVRCLSVILQLNDDFDGGVFTFPYHELTIKLSRGSIIAFPPFWTHPHETSSVEANQFRYTINTWILEKF